VKQSATFNALPNTQEIIMKILSTSTSLQRLVAATILGTLALGCGAFCVAGDDAHVLQAVVKTGDLNLSSPEAAARLFGRLYAAAYEVCGSYSTDSRDLLDLTGVTTCVDNAVKKAVVKAGHPALLAIYNSRHRDALPITVAAARNR
jgi:UrcA family protein